MDGNLLKKVSGLNLSKDEDREFEKTVGKYSSSFDLKLNYLTKPRVECIKDTLVEKLKNSFVVAEEEVQVLNLISYLSFRLGDIDTAFDYNSKALKKDERNGIALANRVRFNRCQLNFYESEKDLQMLETLYSLDNTSRAIKFLAVGELAQSCASFGPKYHDLALSKYASILKDCPQISKDVLIMWKYGYCRCLRRTLHLFNKPEYPDKDPIITLETTFIALIDLTDTSHLQIYTARAWAEVGQLVYSIERMPETFGRDILECIPEQRRCKSSKDYFQRALELGYGDLDVMEICAKFFRYFDKFKKAVGLFEEILPRRQTTMVYHHLALSLQKHEEKKIKKRLKKDKKRQQKIQGITVAKYNSSKAPCQSEEMNLKRLLKCAKEVLPLTFNEQISQALIYLENAVKINPFNYTAEYDKGLLLRQLGQTEDARRVFCDLLKKIETGEIKISCFEQAGYCSLDMARSNPLKSERYSFDAICYFQRAIEIAATLAVEVKYTSLEVRALIPTVKIMLTTPELLEMHDKKLNRLQNLLIDFGKLLPVTKELTSDSFKHTHDLLEKCLREERQDDAALLCILEEIASEVNEEKFAQHLNVILTAASTSLSNGECEPASTRYQICLGLFRFRTKRENIEYDIFLMTDEEPENLKSMRLVSQWLTKYCNLRVIDSDNHCFKGKQILDALTHLSQISMSVLVVVKEPKLDQMVKFFTTTVISMEPPERPQLVILKEKSVELPLGWKTIPTVLLPQTKTKHSNSAVSAWISGLIKNIIHTNVNV